MNKVPSWLADEEEKERSWQKNVNGHGFNSIQASPLYFSREGKNLYIDLK